jgi:hypothetical protein
MLERSFAATDGALSAVRGTGSGLMARSTAMVGRLIARITVTIRRAEVDVWIGNGFRKEVNACRARDRTPVC